MREEQTAYRIGEKEIIQAFLSETKKKGIDKRIEVFKRKYPEGEKKIIVYEKKK